MKYNYINLLCKPKKNILIYNLFILDLKYVKYKYNGKLKIIYVKKEYVI